MNLHKHKGIIFTMYNINKLCYILLSTLCGSMVLLYKGTAVLNNKYMYV